MPTITITAGDSGFEINLYLTGEVDETHYVTNRLNLLTAISSILARFGAPA